MKFFDMAVKNIRKSKKDYTVYFLTLIFSVAIFYVFNSVGDQSILKTVASSENQYLKLLTSIIEALSVFISFVLGFLIIYANSYLIKRRKKEFGVYLILGMRKQDVRKIIVSELAVVASLALAVGTVIGIIVSQITSILVAKMFDYDMSSYYFTVSGKAVLKTLISYGVIFLVVMIFELVSISKLKLIDLLSANKKSEIKLLRKPLPASIIFVLAAVAIIWCYYRINFCFNDLNMNETVFIICLGAVATIVFFWSLSGFAFNVLRSNKKFYRKGLNSYIVRQFTNTINSSSISMGVVCLMLFVSIVPLSAGIAMAYNMALDIKARTPVDYTFVTDMTLKDAKTAAKLFEKAGHPVDEWAEEGYIEIDQYSCKTVTIASGFGSSFNTAREQFPYARWNDPITLVKLSDYNKLCDLYKREKLELGSDNYLMICNAPVISDFRNQGLSEGVTEEIDGVKLTCVKNEVEDTFVEMVEQDLGMGTMIVPDELIEKGLKDKKVKVKGNILAGNYKAASKEEKAEIENSIYNSVKDQTELKFVGKEHKPVIELTFTTAQTIKESRNGMSLIVTYLVMYIGTVFLLCSALLFALKALTQAMDSVDRVSILRKMGCDEKMLDKATFIQVGSFFILPLLVAVIHSVTGIRFVESILVMYDLGKIGWGIGFASVIIAVIYGGYLAVTYNMSKRMK